MLSYRKFFFSCNLSFYCMSLHFIILLHLCKFSLLPSVDVKQATFSWNSTISLQLLAFYRIFLVFYNELQFHKISFLNVLCILNKFVSLIFGQDFTAGISYPVLFYLFKIKLLGNDNGYEELENKVVTLACYHGHKQLCNHRSLFLDV